MTKLPANFKHNKHIDMTKYVWTQNTRSYETQISCFFLPYENNLISECMNLNGIWNLDSLATPAMIIEKQTDPLMRTNTPSIDIEIGNEG